MPQPYSRTTASPKPSWLHARAGAPPKPLQPQTRNGITQNPKAGLWHHQKPQHLSPTPELGHHRYYRALQQRWSIARTSSSSTGSWHCQTLQSPTPGLASPRTPWHDHGTSSLGCYQNFPQPTTRTRAPPKPPSLKPQLESPQFPCQDRGITRTFQLHPGRTRALPELPQSHTRTRTLPKPPNPAHWDCGIIKISQSQTRTGITEFLHQDCGITKTFPSSTPGMAAPDFHARPVALPKPLQLHMRTEASQNIPEWC